MKLILRQALINALAIFLTSLLIHGLTIAGGIQTILLAGFILLLIQRLLQPILAVLTLPLNLLTLGLFSSLLTVLTLYLLTIFVGGVKVTPFTLQGIAYGDLIIPEINFNLPLAFVVTAVVLTSFQNFLEWLSKR